MEIKHSYMLGSNITFECVIGDENTILKVGNKEYPLYSSDVLEFCKAFISTPTKAEYVPAYPEGRKEKILQDFDNRQAMSSTPIKQITRDEWARMEAPVTKYPNVSFGDVKDMGAMAGPISFKK